ncbi:MAG: hypothetical protein P8L23_04535 [Flavobacteriales bacterium]|nr:hypothetical protein [Flavobacteriales bacterium]
MKEINYKKLEDLIKSLEKGLKRLKKGKISTDEMNLLLEDSRNLHERIAVLQYLSFKSPSSKEKATSHKIDAKKEKDVNKEKVEVEEKNQINLLDAIDQEEEKQEDVFGELQFDIPKENKTSINDAFSNSESSLADRFGKKPIDNLSTSIGINEKFLFTNNLFNGSAEDFNEQIKVLNEQNSLTIAMDYIYETLVQKYNWNTKSKQVKKFIDLIERRYM